MNAIAALLRGSLAVEGDWRLAVSFQRLFPGPPGGRARPEGEEADARRREARSDERRPHQDPRRQHLRRQRRARRHRGVAHRPDRALLLRHALPLEVGADGERPAAERALDGRPALLRDPLLPRAGDRHRLHRREALGDPPPHRRQRLSRGADDPEPRREARRTHRPGRRRERLRRPLRGQGCAREEGNVLGPRPGTAASCSATSARSSSGRRGSPRRPRRRSTSRG